MEQQKQDWMGFLASFVDLMNNLMRQYRDNKITDHEILDEVGARFVESHDYAHPELHSSMVRAWTEMQVRMDKIKKIRRKNMKKTDLFRQHMIDIFRDQTNLYNASIPWETRWWFNYTIEMQERFWH